MINQLVLFLRFSKNIQHFTYGEFTNIVTLVFRTYGIMMQLYHTSARVFVKTICIHVCAVSSCSNVYTLVTLVNSATRSNSVKHQQMLFDYHDTSNCRLCNQNSIEMFGISFKLISLLQNLLK